MPEEIFKVIRNAYLSAVNRILFFDYDGTLAPFHDAPEKALPDQAILSLIYQLGRIEQNHVVIISGRDRWFLDAIFSGMNVTLVAEHGFFIRKPGSEWSTESRQNHKWKKVVGLELEKYRQMFPGSWIEVKTSALAWHYRISRTHPDDEMIDALKTDIVTRFVLYNLEVLTGDCVVEVKSRAVNKGTAAIRLINQNSFDFVLAVGDDNTDEFLFEKLPEKAISIKIGDKDTVARYRLQNPGNVAEMINHILA